MRLRILTRPTGTIDGVSLDYFRVGGVYEVGSELACVFLAERWAELLIGNAAVFVRSPTPCVENSERSVLVVDDECEIQRLTESLLTAHGYHVAVAGHGRDAIRRLCQQCPDLIVLDLNMPVMNGWQFCAEQRALPDKKRASVPVLLMTGADDAATQADRLKAVGVIRKPFYPDDMLDAVSAAICLPRDVPEGR